MGDRANIVIEADNDMFPHPVFFYTHWAGYRIKKTLQAALIRGRERWDDAQYLSRVIFCEMVGNDTGITGLGISTKIGDHGGNLLCVNMEENMVRERDSRKDIGAPILNQWTFADFIALKLEDEDDE